MRTTMLAATALALALPAIAAPPPTGWTGVWRNASNSVHIRAAPCGKARNAGMCGTVIWGSAKAKADVAARGRTLIGTQLFRDFRPGDDGVWSGQVYVPDIDKRFSGTIALAGPNRLIGHGCLFRGMGCKEQIWTRLRR